MIVVQLIDEMTEIIDTNKVVSFFFLMNYLQYHSIYMDFDNEAHMKLFFQKNIIKQNRIADDIDILFRIVACYVTDFGFWLPGQTTVCKM